jgi:CRP-like cAMP-binding protein
MDQQRAVRSFDALRDVDLQQIYDQSKQEVLRDYAFRIALDTANSLEKLTALVFDSAAGVERWTARELLELSNRFRLLSAPEYEIRLYEASRNAEFRTIPRAREFYLLALNKVGRTTEAIAECQRLIAAGGENGLVWGTLGDAYSLKMRSAEKFATALVAVRGDSSRVDGQSKAHFVQHFPDLDLHMVSCEQVHALRRQLLDVARQTYGRGFARSGAAFPGLCWMIRTIEQRTDLLAERAYLLERRRLGTWDVQAEASRRQIEAQLSTLERDLASQPTLLHIALEMGGGGESLDYWTHAGALQLAFTQARSMVEIRPILARAFATLDADFKLQILLNDLTSIRDQYARTLDIVRTQVGKTDELEQLLEQMQVMLAELTGGQARFIAGGKTRGAALNESYRALAEASPTRAEAVFLKRTLNFWALTSNLVPQYIQGGIGRVGARVPDLTINRHVQEDLRTLLTARVLPALPPAVRTQPRAVIAVIQQLIGTWLGLAELQDLQSPGHHAFDTRSDGLILLSGIDPVMRKGSRSTTDLTAALLLRTGDCRETMYLNGALFAYYQQMQVYEKLAAAMECLRRGDQGAVQRITAEEIPALWRYQLRGGHVAVYVDGIAMQRKYHAERVSDNDPTAIERPYSVEAFRAGQPLSRYELDNAILRVTYTDGTTRTLAPKDPVSGQWRPIAHLPVASGGGIPLIPEAGAQGGTIATIQLLNLVEEHSMSFLYDRDTGEVELCDGFYNERLFDSPYQFGSGRLETSDMFAYHGLLRAGTRAVRGADGQIQYRQVFIEFLPFSKTDYTPSLGEGDLPWAFQLMGQLFLGKLPEERQRLEDGTSAIPTVLERVYAWQLQQRTATQQQQAFDQRFARVLLELARDRPELVALQDVRRDQHLITQDDESDSVYLVLSGQFLVYRDGEPLVRGGQPVTAGSGTILGEISALRGGLPTATVVGDGVVLRIAKAEFRRQLDINPTFRQSVEELVKTRLEALDQFTQAKQTKRDH